jgi:matrix metalloproteinase-14 (membrane-inserted)
LRNTALLFFKEKIETNKTCRFNFSGSRWRVKTISYKISRYPTTKKLTNSDVDAEIKKALDVWAEYTDLNFEMKTTGQVTIK